MSNLSDEQIDKIIKQSFKQDINISEKANAVFRNFDPQKAREQQLREQQIKEQKFREQQLRIQQMKVEQERAQAQAKQETNKTNQKVIEGLFYKRLNKFLSVAAVTLTVVLVGGTALYFNKDKLTNNTNNGQNTTTIIEARYLIKNEQLQYSKEQVVKEIENKFIKAYLVGSSDVGVEFYSTYWDEIGKKNTVVSSQIYKIDGITGPIEDIFLGSTGNSGLPYLFILLKDGTAMYVDLHGYSGYTSSLYYYASPIEGLTDIVGFEEKTRNYSYSTDEYIYVNAIRSDGKRKEIELDEVNSWYDTSTKTFDKYNEKYIKAHNGGEIPDDRKGDFTVDNIHYWGVDRDSRYVYCLKGEFANQSLYRVERSTGSETLLASGIGGMARDNPDGRISFYVNSNGNYVIYELDDNIIFRNNANNSIITEVTKTEKEETKGTENNYTEEKVKYKRENINTNTYDEAYLEVSAEEDENGRIEFTISAVHGSDKDHVNIGELTGIAEVTSSLTYLCERVETGNEYALMINFYEDEKGKYAIVKEVITNDVNPYAGEGVTFAGRYNLVK